MKRFKILGLCGCLCWLAAAVFSFEWPVADRQVVTTFGQDVAEGFSTGIALPGSDQPVSPIADGEIIFTYDEGRDYTSLPRGAGSFMILYHEGGIQSVYSHLARGSLEIPASFQLHQSELLGVVGNTGASGGNSLFLQIIDIEENLVLNPLRQLSSGLEDRAPPVVEKILLVREGLRRELVNGSAVLPGNVSLLIGTRDRQQNQRRGGPFIAPYKIILSQNGIEASSLVFDALKVEAGRFVLNSSGRSFTEIYPPGGEGLVNLGELNLVQGMTRFRFLVTDYGGREGNTSSADLMVTVTGE